MSKTVLTKDNFYSGASSLRAVYDERFKDPKKADSRRFVWDFWHVPDQYTLVRTPAKYFFPQKQWRDFLGALGKWGQENLGCGAITDPWLSYYIEGCEQKFHTDVPHGPWAFVYSLSLQGFTGGETFILNPEILDYWRSYPDFQDREQAAIITKITPKFNRLVVFDPRLPHGVTPVKGTMDPRNARIVIHGWFAEPKPYLSGALKPSQVYPVVNEAVEKFTQAVEGSWDGIMSLRFRISPAGTSKMVVLANTVQSIGRDRSTKDLMPLLKKYVSELKFPKCKASSEITLPLLFR